MKEIPAPYVGIRPFERDDWPIFFGREALSNQLLHKLETNRFVAVIGSSGSGKSSVVKAGLLPLVEEHGMLMDANEWLTLVCRPGDDPLTSLSRELVRCEQRNVSEVDIATNTLSSDLLRAELRKSDRGIIPALERLKLSDSTHVLLVVDQFEELFGFRLGPTSPPGAQEEAERFVTCILDSCKAPVQPFSKHTGSPLGLDQRIWVILTMRSDFIGHCEIFPPLSKKVSESQFLVPVLDPEEKREAIIRPSLAGDIEGAQYPPFTFADDLVSIIINESGTRIDQLPLMQHALMRTWTEASGRALEAGDTKLCVTLDSYDSIGRIEKALSRHADDAFRDLTADSDGRRKTAIARCLFLLLCDVSAEGKITRRRPLIDEVAMVAKATPEEVLAVVHVFQDGGRNFVVASPPGIPSATTRLDVSHEALLRQWMKFSGPGGWLEEERANAAELRRLVDRAEQHERRGGSLLTFREAYLVSQWERANDPSEAWARRYDVTHDQWQAVWQFCKRSLFLRRRARLLILILVETVVIVVTLVVTLLLSRTDALLTTSLQRSIGVTEGSLPSATEREVLWEVAQLPTEGGFDLKSFFAHFGANHEPVRKRFIGEALKDIDSSQRALKWNGTALHAAEGFNPQLHKFSEQRADKLIADLKLALQKEQNPYDLARDATAVANLSRNFNKPLDIECRKRAAAAVVTAMETAAHYPLVTELGEALAELSSNLDVTTASDLAQRVAKALETEGDIYRRERLAVALADITRGLDSAAAAVLAKSGVNAAIKTLNSSNDPNRLQSVINVFAELASRLDNATVGELAHRIAGEMENENGMQRLAYLGQTLAILLARQPDSSAAKAAAGRVGLKMKDERDWDEMRRLQDALDALKPLLDDNGKSNLSRDLADMVKNETDSGKLGLLALSLASLPLEAGAIQNLAERLADKLKTEGEWGRIVNLGQALAKLAGMVDTPTASKLAEDLADALKRGEENSQLRLSLGEVLMRLGQRHRIDTAAAVAERIAAAMDAERESFALASLGRALVVLTRPGQLDPSRAIPLRIRGIRPLLEAVDTGGDSEKLRSLSYAMGWLIRDLATTNPSPSLRKCILVAMSNLLAGIAPGSQESILVAQLADLLQVADLAEVLKYPSCLGHAQDLIMQAVSKKTKRTVGPDISKLAEQAKDLGMKNLYSPAVRPKIEDARKELEAVMR